jgi:phenylacetate-CoA ligase
VHPSQIVTLAKRCPEAVRASLVRDGEMAADHMTLCVEAAPRSKDGQGRMRDQLINLIREVARRRGEVHFGDVCSFSGDHQVVVYLRLGGCWRRGFLVRSPCQKSDSD